MREDERTIAVNIALTPKFVVIVTTALLFFVLGSAFILSRDSATASILADPASPDASGVRRVYLTDGSVPGSVAEDACTEGFHFASLWEIADISNLQYDISVGGYSTDDSGSGPPSAFGWIRTGGDAADVTQTPGLANCGLWTSKASNEYGSIVKLPTEWTTDAQDISVWDANARACSVVTRVWCVED